MIPRSIVRWGLFALALGAIFCGGAKAAKPDAAPPKLQKRWLFYWRDMNDPKQVDRMIADFPRAKQDGYNAVVFSYNVAPSKAVKLKQAAQKYGLGLVAMVMGSGHDRNDAEGLSVQNALFVAHDGRATLEQDNPTKVVNGGFEDVTENHFNGWAFQDSEGASTFADHDVVHGGKTSLRMENVAQNPGQHCRIEQKIALKPHRQYHISVWVKTQDLSGITPEVKMLTPDGGNGISYQTFHSDKTQDWTREDIVFNSLDNTNGLLYLGTWGGKAGKLWWDDLTVEEIGLVNVLRRPGCPVTVKGDDGTAYEEGRDFEKIVDPQLNPWRAYHDAPPIKLTANSRIKDGARLRVSYYHPVVVYEDRVTFCLSEPQIFADWKEEVETANKLYHPDAFFMEHDEMRVIDQCALCQSKHMTPGELLAWNVHKAAQIIRDVRPDAGIWVWSDMFDPYHNATDHFYLVNGSLKGSWKGLDK
ncbi:MAG: carbohydrate binding domain-containing protein, partial [Armatimonadota bacterium]|nr:carbohydrate binding domain-containing protein [Armatimonadota bacterium]